MNNLILKFKTQKGSTAILITLIVLAAMLFMTLTVNSIVQNGILMSRAHLNSTKAYYAAESGVERILRKIRKSTATPPVAFDPTVAGWTTNNCVRLDDLSTCALDCAVDDPNLYLELPNDTKYSIRYVYVDPTATFTSTGIYDDIVKRVVEVKYDF